MIEQVKQWIRSNFFTKLEIAGGKMEMKARTMALTDGLTAPSAVVGSAILYVDTADGDLKIKFGDGVTKTIATDT